MKVFVKYQFVSLKIQNNYQNFLILINFKADSTTIHLKVAKVQPEPGRVEDYHVPIIISSDVLTNLNIPLWDLTTQQVRQILFMKIQLYGCYIVITIILYYNLQIFKHINGLNHISKIAFEADVELNLVKSCIQNLIYYGIVTLIPIFQYSNVYVTTPKICNLIENTSLQEECLK